MVGSQAAGSASVEGDADAPISRSLDGFWQTRGVGLLVFSFLLYAWLGAGHGYRLITQIQQRGTDENAASQITPPRFVLNINAATQGELRALPEVGPQLARRIVQDRRAKGPFRSLQDLTRVRGIGPKTLEKLRPFITVSD